MPALPRYRGGSGLSDGEVSDTSSGELQVQGGTVALVSRAADALTAAGLSVSDLALRRPTLDDVFLSLTGHAAEEDAA